MILFYNLLSETKYIWVNLNGIRLCSGPYKMSTATKNSSPDCANGFGWPDTQCKPYF